MQGEIWRRSRYLIALLWGEVIEAHPEPVRLAELIAAGCDMVDPEGVPRWQRKTVENVMRDLAAFGAVRVKEKDGGRDRLVSATVLGLAWQAGVPIPRELSDIKKAYEQVEEFFDMSEAPIDAAILAEVEDWVPDASGAAELAAEVEIDLG